jgi:hypothetical protein
MIGGDCTHTEKPASERAEVLRACIRIGGDEGEAKFYHTKTMS